MKRFLAVLIVIITVVLASCTSNTIEESAVSIDELCAEGDYAQAYQKATDGEKTAILAENIAAVQSSISADYLKDPNSFKLVKAYYHEDPENSYDYPEKLVLYISGTNSYGQAKNSYWLYVLDGNEWGSYGTFTDLSSVDLTNFSDADSFAQNLTEGMGRSMIKTAMDDGIEISRDGVQRINTLFEYGKLDEIKLINAN